MDDAERERMRREILDDVGALLHERLAAGEWGRALVEVVRGPDGEPLVANVDVEEIVGDEARVDAAFAPDSVGPLLPVLAKATEALCEIEDVKLEDVGGGTFLRQRAGGMQWLPGLVHLPSPAFDAQWEALTTGLEQRRAALEERFGLGRHERYDVDIERQTIAFSSGGRARVTARATLVGTFSRASRTFAWGGYNRNLPEPVRRAAAELVDSIPERDMWELSTPALACDEHTAWGLAALVCERAGADGVYASPHQGGIVFLLLRDVRDAGE